MTSTPNGVFRLGDELLRAIRDPGVTKDHVTAFRDLAEAVATGNKTSDEAAAQLAEISSAFAKILEWTNNNAAALGVLIGVLSLIIACYAIWDSDQSSAQAHADAQAQIQAIEKQTKAIEYASQAQLNKQQAQQIDEQIQQLNAISQARSSSISLQKTMIQKPPPQTRTKAGTGNRHERRKAARLAKRQSSTLP